MSRRFLTFSSISGVNRNCSLSSWISWRRLCTIQ